MNLLLPDIICFVKGDVIPRHCGEDKFSDIIHNKHYTSIENYSRVLEKYKPGCYSFVDDNDNYHENSNEVNYVASVIYPGKYYNNYKNFLSDIYENSFVGEYIKFPPGGCHLVPKENILRYNIEFYKWLRSIVDYEIRPGEAFLLERATTTIFTTNWIIRDKYRNN